MGTTEPQLLGGEPQLGDTPRLRDTGPPPTGEEPPSGDAREARAESSPEPEDAGGAVRGARLIRSGATTEIPVHLLFRDDAAGTPLPLPPTVVGRRRGTGEQPRVERRPAAGVRVRPTPEVDTVPTERPGASAPGAVGLLGACAGAMCGAGALWWGGVLPGVTAGLMRLPDSGGSGMGAPHWALLAASGALSAFALCGLTRGRVGRAWVLTRFGRYRGSVRRTGLVWLNPFLRRGCVDVRLRHWRSEPMPAVDADGVALSVVVQVVWRITDSARAALAVEDHLVYLRACAEAALTRVLSQHPVDAFRPGVPTLRDAESVGDVLTRLLAADAVPVGIEVFSAQPTRIEYAPEVASAMLRRRVAALDAQHRETVLGDVVDAVDDTVARLTARGLVELDDYERKALVKDLTVAFCTGRGGEA